VDKDESAPLNSSIAGNGHDAFSRHGPRSSDRLKLCSPSRRVRAVWILVSVHLGRRSARLKPSDPVRKGYPTEFTLGHNVAFREEVDAVMGQAQRAGAVIVKQAHETFWGGYSGCFEDPDGICGRSRGTRIGQSRRRRGCISLSVPEAGANRPVLSCRKLVNVLASTPFSRLR
jgi:hypothetical protein